MGLMFGKINSKAWMWDLVVAELVIQGLPAQSIAKATSPVLGHLSNYIVRGEDRSAKSVKGYSSPKATDNQGQLFQSHATGYNSSKNN